MENITDIRVAKVLEIGKIVINKGTSDKINNLMEFIVYEEGDEIIDPITNKSLGILENPKGTFKTSYIQDNLTTLVTKNKLPNKISLSLLSFSEGESEFELLKTIKIGDKVKIINLL